MFSWISKMMLLVAAAIGVACVYMAVLSYRNAVEFCNTLERSN